MTDLTANHRCDTYGCPAQAYIRAHLTKGELLFCGHHGRLHEPALLAAGARLDDQTHRLVEGVEKAKTEGVS